MHNRIDIKVFFGIAIIAAGLILFLENLGIFYFPYNLWDFWPLVFIAIGLNQIIQPKHARQTFSGWIFLGIGLLFLLDNLDVIYFDFGDLWPLILILIGLNILKNHVWKTGENEGEGADFINLALILGGGDHKFTSQNITGGKITAIMGGGKIDLRQAGSQKETIIIDTFAFWGGIEIVVPYHWQVNIQGSPILGGMVNSTSAPVNINGVSTNLQPRTLIVKGSAIMGGVEVKN